MIVDSPTLEMILKEQERLYSDMQKHYPGYVERGVLTTYERDHRYNCIKKLISILEQAIKKTKETEPQILHDTLINTK